MKSSIRTTWKLVWPFLSQRVPALIGVITLGFLASIGPTAILFLLAPLWKYVLFPGQEVALPEGAGASSPDFVTKFMDRLLDWVAGERGLDPTQFSEEIRLNALFVIVTVALSLALLSAASQFGFTMLSRWLSLRVVVDLRMQLAEHLMSLSMGYHRARCFGDLLSRISADVEKLLGTIQNMLRDFIEKPANALYAFGAAYIAAPRLGLGILIVLPLLAVPVALLSKKVRKRSTKSLTTLGASVQAMTQMFQGVRTVKAYRAEARETEAFRGVSEKYLRHTMGMVRAIAATDAWTLLFSQGGLALLLIPIGWFAITGGIVWEPSKLLIFFLMMSRAYTNVKGFTKAYTKVQESVGASERLQEILDHRVDVVEAENPTRISSLGNGIHFADLGLRYSDEDDAALAHIEFEIKPGETVAVVGPSGSGKSTLADLLCRFMDPTSGSIEINGVDLRQLSRDDWSATCAHVDQVPFLFHTSIAENIRYGKPDATEAEIIEAAKAANIHDFIAGLPNGYETDVADAGGRLSGGQRQRIVIARAVLRDAPLLILDEATSALDTESEVKVQDALDRLMAHRTVLVIAHRLSTIKNADRIAVLEDGELVELGTHDELLKNDKTYSRLHSLQSLSAEADLITPHSPAQTESPTGERS